MRFIILAILISFLSTADAQVFRGGDRGDMDKARDCLDSVDRDKLRDYAEEAEEMTYDAREMCEDGDDSAARDIVTAYIEEMKNNKEFDKLAECSEILRDSMPNMQIAELPGIEEYEDELDDICYYVD
jgi:hypothetical protein